MLTRHANPMTKENNKRRIGKFRVVCTVSVIVKAHDNIDAEKQANWKLSNFYSNVNKILSVSKIN